MILKNNSMKNIINLIVLLFIFSSAVSQNIKPIKYQIVALDNNGEVIANKYIDLRITVFKDKFIRHTVYKELQSKLTDNNGFVSIKVGAGKKIYGDYSSIKLNSASKYFVKTEIYHDEISNFVVSNISQIIYYKGSTEHNTISNDPFWQAYKNYIYRKGNVCIGPITERVKDIPLVVSNNLDDQNSNTSLLASFVKNTSLTSKNSDILRIDYNLRENFYPYLYFKLGMQDFQFDDKGGKYNLYVRPQGTMLWGGYEYPNFTINNQGNVGINQENPKSKLQITDGDVYIDKPEHGIILKSEDEQCWRITIQKDGKFHREKILCPEKMIK